MLDVNGRINADPCTQQLLHVLIPLGMAAARRIGVGQFIHQNQLGLARERAVQIELMQFNAFVWNAFRGELLQPIQQSHGFWAGMRLDIAGHYVKTGFFSPMCGFQHGVGFADAGGIAKENFQPSSGRGFLFLYGFQQSVRIWPRQFRHSGTSQFFLVFSQYSTVHISMTLLFSF